MDSLGYSAGDTITGSFEFNTDDFRGPPGSRITSTAQVTSTFTPVIDRYAVTGDVVRLVESPIFDPSTDRLFVRDSTFEFTDGLRLDAYHWLDLRGLPGWISESDLNSETSIDTSGLSTNAGAVFVNSIDPSTGELRADTQVPVDVDRIWVSLLDQGLEIAETFISEPVFGALNSVGSAIDSGLRNATGFGLEIANSFIDISLDLGVFGDFWILNETIDYLGEQWSIGDLWEYGVEEIWNRGGNYAEASYEDVDYQIRFDVEFDAIQFPTNLSPDFLIRGIDETYVEGTSSPIWNAVEWYAEHEAGNNLVPLVAAHEFGHLLGLPDEYCPRGSDFFDDPFLCTNLPFESPENRRSDNLMVDLTPIVLDRHYEVLLDRINKQLDLDFVLGNLPPIGSMDFVVPEDFEIQHAHFASTTVPEPGTLALFGMGLLGMVAARRRKKVCAHGEEKRLL